MSRFQRNRDTATFAQQMLVVELTSNLSVAVYLVFIRC